MIVSCARSPALVCPANDAGQTSEMVNLICLPQTLAMQITTGDLSGVPSNAYRISTKSSIRL